MSSKDKSNAAFTLQKLLQNHSCVCVHIRVHFKIFVIFVIIIFKNWLTVWKSLLPPYTACVFGMCYSNMSPPCLSHSVSSANTPAGLYDSIPVIFSQGVTLDSGKQRCLLLRPAYQMALKDKIIFTKKQTSDSHVSHSFIVCPWVLIVQRRETSIRQACVWCFLMWDLDVRRWIVKF